MKQPFVIYIDETAHMTAADWDQLLRRLREIEKQKAREILELERLHSL